MPDAFHEQLDELLKERARIDKKVEELIEVANRAKTDLTVSLEALVVDSLELAVKKVRLASSMDLPMKERTKEILGK